MLGKKNIFSDELLSEMQNCLNEKKQVILFLNRRGYSVHLICDECGEVKFCPNCAVSMVYHRNGDILKCHICGYCEIPNYKCPKCSKNAIKYEGVGIQKVEDELSLHFPQAKILRMDADTTSTKSGHANIISDFATQKYDILLGTQMVAKGLDFTHVKLVGVLQADIGLSAPDFRAGEKMFQLLTQVAGRAGRADSGGLVIIQTFSPQENSIKYAQNHDFCGYYEISIGERKKLNYPPFIKIAKIKIVGENEKDADNFAKNITYFLTKTTDEIKVMGPAQPDTFKAESKYIFVIMIKSLNYKAIAKSLELLKKSFANPNSCGSLYKIDIDPSNLW
jgi:primosomal protein N' (replication factor Y)